jgi:imidazolonepropionase-like amidohydrolase
MRTPQVILIHAAAVLAAVLSFSHVGAARLSGPAYAITGARIYTAAGAPIAGGTIVIRNGVIEDVGAGVSAPADAVAIDGANMNVYPGLIDMANGAPVDNGDEGAAAVGRGGGAGRGGSAQAFSSYEEAERAKRAAMLRPDFAAADHLRPDATALSQWASAGVTSMLAVPGTGVFKGQSALVNVVIPPDDPQISTVADYRNGLAVVKAPVAMHIDMGARVGGPGYPASLLGTIAFTRQGLSDARWQGEAEAHYQRTGARGPRPVIEPALDALGPVLARQLPAAFDADEAREIDRALAMAAEFNLDPIIVGASTAAERTAELAAARARVILSVNYPTGRGAGAGGGGRGGAGQTLAQLKAQADAPKAAAALARANVTFAFTSGGLATPADFLRNISRAVKDGGLSADTALRAATIDAARMAGAGDRVGSIEKGKIANLVVTEGDLFDGGRIRHVFIDGRPVALVESAPAGGRGRSGAGGSRR